MKLENEPIKGFKKLRAYELPIDIYEKHVTIYVAATMSDAIKAAEQDYKTELHEPDDIPSEGCYGYAIRLVKNGVMANLVLLNMGAAERGADILSTCAHEAIHVSWDILDWVGVKISGDNHEAQTYLADYVFAGCKYAVKDYIKRYKSKVKL